jgi:hypothetical protein
MKNGVAADHGFGERGEIEVIAFDELELWVFEGAFEEFSLAGGEIVETDDGFAIGKQAVSQGAADETSYASDKNLFHASGEG